jgi:curved DNA-binding protein CbpA
VKDYYYILGVAEVATKQEIKEAYTKLAQKFHPSVNQGDAFFRQYYNAIQEAYKVLGNTHLKGQYDQEKTRVRQLEPLVVADGSTLQPVISKLFANKKILDSGDFLTLTWETRFADSVLLEGVGAVAASGVKTIQPHQWKGDTENIVISLLAINSSTKEQVSKQLVIKNKAFIAKAISPKKELGEKIMSVNQYESEKIPLHAQKTQWIAYLLVGIFGSLIILLLAILYSMNPFL